MIASFLLLATALSSADANLIVGSATPAIDRANREWASAIRIHDADALSRSYAEFATFVLPDGSAIRGRSAIRHHYASMSVRLIIVDAGVVSAGRIAAGHDDVYEWGSAWTVVRAPDGGRSRHGGRYLTAWHRQPDGRWLIVRNLAF